MLGLRRHRRSSFKILTEDYLQPRILFIYLFNLEFYTQLKWAFPGGSEGKASAHYVGNLDSIPESERSPREGNSNPLQYSYLENPMARGAW